MLLISSASDNLSLFDNFYVIKLHIKVKSNIFWNGHRNWCHILFNMLQPLMSYVLVLNSAGKLLTVACENHCLKVNTFNNGQGQDSSKLKLYIEFDNSSKVIYVLSKIHHFIFVWIFNTF